ncbi:MAG: citrate/2-methylcitrate synthase, partial [Candidatus Poseidoniaceae archaeon]
ENPKISNPNANVDIASGTLLNFVGLQDAEYYTTFFGWARVAGIGAQIVDERTIMRGGKGILSTDQSTLQKNRLYVILNENWPGCFATTSMTNHSHSIPS